jgi:hypothetical protein
MVQSSQQPNLSSIGKVRMTRHRRVELARIRMKAHVFGLKRFERFADVRKCLIGVREDLRANDLSVGVGVSAVLQALPPWKTASRSGTVGAEIFPAPYDRVVMTCRRLIDGALYRWHRLRSPYAPNVSARVRSPIGVCPRARIESSRSLRPSSVSSPNTRVTRRRIEPVS